MDREEEAVERAVGADNVLLGLLRLEDRSEDISSRKKVVYI
jgi:hypothetical protein